MIVRVFTEGQYRLDDALIKQLNEIDVQLEQAIGEANEQAFSDALQLIHDLIAGKGTKVSPDELVASDVALPDREATMQEVAQILLKDGLIPG